MVWTITKLGVYVRIFARGCGSQFRQASFSQFLAAVSVSGGGVCVSRAALLFLLLAH